MTEIQIFMAGVGFSLTFGLLSWGASFLHTLIAGGRNE